MREISVIIALQVALRVRVVLGLIVCLITKCVVLYVNIEFPVHRRRAVTLGVEHIEVLIGKIIVERVTGAVVFAVT